MSRFAVRIIAPAAALALVAGVAVATVVVTSPDAVAATASTSATATSSATASAAPALAPTALTDSWTATPATVAPHDAKATSSAAPAPSAATSAPIHRQPAGSTTQGAAHQQQGSTAQRTATPAPTPTGSGSAPRSSGSSGEPPASSEFESAVLALVNQYRAQAGLSALKLDSRLTTAAKEQASYQASIETGTHTDAKGGNGGQRITAAGYSWCSWGENAAWNYETPDAVVAAWMASPDHKANIMKAGFTHMGLATARGANGVLYWTQDFGKHC